MEILYVKKDGAMHEVDAKRFELLWGDPCHVVRTVGDSVEVHARGRLGLVKAASLGDDPKLLELYIIDVGQGDGVLMKTPDGKWHLIDAGVAVEQQMTRRGAANFLAWKFLRDLRLPKVSLETVTMSHPDADHYGGLVNVLGGTLPRLHADETGAFPVEVKTFYHPGMGRFAGADPLGLRTPGTVAPFPQAAHGINRAGSFITELLFDQASFATPARPFTDEFAKLAALVGTVPTHVVPLDHAIGHLPGYGPTSEVRIRVLGPIVETFDGSRGLRFLSGSESITRNGHSVLYRVELGQARILLTGDLNTTAQRLLLSYLPPDEFAVDVAKGCHHGADDVDIGFVKAMAARATVISSGDNEDYAHPRPRVMGASAKYGREGVDLDNEAVAPLLYSTELARSVRLGFTDKVRAGTPAETFPPEVVDVRDQDRRFRDLERTPLSFGLVYGLVNVRTDGERILLATLEEKGSAFDKRVILAGRSPA